MTEEEGKTGSPAHSHIRSFSMRRGRITDGQRRAHEQVLPRVAVDYAKQPLDLVQAFGRQAQTVLEIGFGMGETTAAIAAARPDVNFLGVEVFFAGVGSLARRIGEQNLANLRIVQHDAVEVVRDMIPMHSLAGVHIYFPDPWPKARHHKRRLIAPAFVSLLASRLECDGYLHCATDWLDYAEQMLAVLSGEPLLRNAHAGYAPDAANPLCRRPTTKFQARGERLGHGIRDLLFVRRSGVAVHGGCRPLAARTMTGAGPGLAAQANVQERPLLPENHPLLPSGDTAMAETRDEQRLWKRFVDSRFMMLTTITSDDAPYSCPMTLQRAQDGALWFFTSDESPTVKHLERVLRVGVSVMDNDDSFYFAGYGNARIMRDRAAMAPLFNAMVKAWFPAGMDDPHLVLLKVELERAEYWDNASNRMVQALAIAKSLVTGKPPADIGDHGELDPAAQPARTPVGV